jgi:ubiquitin carboxyl-terminal hydrolase 34
VENVSRPYLVYHKDFQKEYFPNVISLVKKCILMAPDKCLRDINRDKFDVVLRSIDNMQKRNLTKDERDRESELFKLEICLLCLKSGYLERRIQGIKDLNQLIRNNMIKISKTIPNAVLIQWLKDNDVFSIMFDPKKTHLQIV